MIQRINEYFGIEKEKFEELGINPSDIHMHLWKNVWWICSKCGYEWKATPGRRSEGSGCRICANKIHKT